MTRFDFSRILQHAACAVLAVWVAFATIDTIVAEGMRKTDMQRKPPVVALTQPASGVQG